MEQEVDGLNKRGYFDDIEVEKLPTNGNIPNSRFVLTMKQVGSQAQIFKAIPVVLGHFDKERSFLVHETKSLKNSSLQMILGYDSITEHKPRTQDISQAYTQSMEALNDPFMINLLGLYKCQHLFTN